MGSYHGVSYVEKVFMEANRLQYNRTILHNPKLLLFKVIYVAFVLSTIFYLDLAYYIPIIVANIAVLLALRAYRVVATTLVYYMVLSGIIVGIDYLTGTFSLRVLKLMVYGYTTFTAIALFYVTTPPHHLRRYLGLNSLTLAYLIIHYTLNEVIEITSSLKARGWEPKLNPLKYIGLLYNSLMLMVTRITYIEDSLKARGVD